MLYSIPDLDAELLPNPREEFPPEEMCYEPKIYPRKGHALKFKFERLEKLSNSSRGGAFQCYLIPSTFLHFIPADIGIQSTRAVAKKIVPFDRLSHNNNYFLGNDPSKWATDCGNYQRVMLREVW